MMSLVLINLCYGVRLQMSNFNIDKNIDKNRKKIAKSIPNNDLVLNYGKTC